MEFIDKQELAKAANISGQSVWRYEKWQFIPEGERKSFGRKGWQTLYPIYALYNAIACRDLFKWPGRPSWNEVRDAKELATELLNLPISELSHRIQKDSVKHRPVMFSGDGPRWLIWLTLKAMAFDEISPVSVNTIAYKVVPIYRLYWENGNIDFDKRFMISPLFIMDAQENEITKKLFTWLRQVITEYKISE